MADLTIPKEHQPILNRVRTMPEQALKEVLSALETFPETAPPVQGLSAGQVEEIQGLLMELYRVRSFLDEEVPEFASDLAEGLQDVEKFPSTEIPGLRERLTRLLSIRSLSIGSKAESLKAEYERRYCSARMITDARPIYGDDPSEPPVAGMIVHTLRISYHDNTAQLQEFYLAMDADDITAMRGLLDRAEVKARSLESLLAAAGMRIVAP